MTGCFIARIFFCQKVLTDENISWYSLFTDENTTSGAINGHDRGQAEKVATHEGGRRKYIMDKTEYLLASQIAELMGEKWSRQRVHTELKRGKFPQPVTYVGNQPLWTAEQIEKVKKERGN